MRRQDIQLLALARQGDTAARCEAGRRYLLGVDGFPQHIATGLDYLNHANVRELPQAARIVAESLALEDILQLRQEGVLAQAAAAGSAPAQVKLGVWLCVRHGKVEEGARWLDKAGAAGHEAAMRAMAALRQPDAEDPMTAFLSTLTASGDLKGPLVATISAQQALAERDLPRLAGSLRTALALTPVVTTELAELVTAAVKMAEENGRPLLGIDPQAIEAALDMRTSRGDRDAAYALGRALCGIPCGVLVPETLAAGPNMRKGVALLLRAADGGCEEAWLHLYRMHGDHRLSVANPQMARFCLEKAALGGQTEAQRKLGALMLRASDTLADSEQAIQWLYQAAAKGDRHATSLMQSLVLPLDGADAQAASAIELVRRDDPWLAVRMQLSRHFGLTKLEALCVDPADGLRPWGLVVGKNPFISQIRLSAARAIPALSDAAIDAARRAASFFGQSSRDAQAFEGDLRRRSLRQRRAFERHGLDESMFFATATSMTLEALRLGPKWAFRAKEPLQLALAACPG
ncbi:MAG: sel1 repeat family protein [Rhizobiales bacterium]|nr:sel1 repeat family protein [Rhizobacter sp.]